LEANQTVPVFLQDIVPDAPEHQEGDTVDQFISGPIKIEFHIQGCTYCGGLGPDRDSGPSNHRMSEAVFKILSKIFASERARAGPS